MGYNYKNMKKALMLDENCIFYIYIIIFHVSELSKHRIQYNKSVLFDANPDSFEEVRSGSPNMMKYFNFKSAKFFM